MRTANFFEIHFNNKHRLSKIFNRNNLKVSYSCLPNIASIISSHNKSILSTKPADKSKTCNCRNKDSCPLKGNCLQEQVIYKCTITSSESQEEAKYIGLTENSFKTRWNQHNFTFRHEDKANSTELSKHIWSLQKQDIQPILSWEIIDHARPFANGGKTCNLCLTEKFHIINSKQKLLNKRPELISTCRHVNKHLLKNIKSVPPDTWNFLKFMVFYRLICHNCF